MPFWTKFHFVVIEWMRVISHTKGHLSGSEVFVWILGPVTKAKNRQREVQTATAAAAIAEDALPSAAPDGPAISLPPLPGASGTQHAGGFMNVRCSGMSWCSCGGRCRDYHGPGFTVVGAAGALYYNLYDVIQHSNTGSELLLGGFCSSLGDSTCTQHICF